MNDSVLIESRKSVRSFRNTPVPADLCEQLRNYYDRECRKLLPDLKTDLMILDTGAREALEGAAGYQEFLIGAPKYLVLLSAADPHAGVNAGYIMEDLVLKLTDLGLDSCWVSFADAAKVREALALQTDGLEVAAIVAFGYGERARRKLRLNILSMSNVDTVAQHEYFSPKKDVYEMVSLEELGNHEGLDEVMGFYEDMLWNSFYAASLAPSYLNRQPYAFVLRDHQLLLVRLADAYTDEVSVQLDLGIVMLHYAAVASQWVGKVDWDLAPVSDLKLPEGCSVAAACKV